MLKARERASAAAIAAAAILLFVVFYEYGFYVTAHGEPASTLALAKAWRGHAIGFAWFLTNLGWAQALVPLYLAALFVAIRYRAWRARMIALIVTGLTSWGLADFFQRYFARPRRTDWLMRHEHAYSYPSSHASTSTDFYLFAGLLILFSGLPSRVRYPALAVLAAVWLGICWSRLSLAAHYPTDVAGGMILGFALMCAAVAALRLAGERTVRA